MPRLKAHQPVLGDPSVGHNILHRKGVTIGDVTTIDEDEHETVGIQLRVAEKLLHQLSQRCCTIRGFQNARTLLC